MLPTGHQVRCSEKWLRHLAVALRLAIALGAAILCLASAHDLCGQDQKQPSQESSLDRAVRELGGPDARTGASPASAPSNPPSARSAPTGEAEADAAESFLASWRLFRYSYLVGWLVGLLLSLVGVIVVARDQVFIGAAVSQASTLGIALALCASSVFPLHDRQAARPHSTSWLCCDSFQAAMAVCLLDAGGTGHLTGRPGKPRKPRSDHRLGVSGLRQPLRPRRGPQPARLGRNPPHPLFQHHRSDGDRRGGVRRPAGDHRLVRSRPRGGACSCSSRTRRWRPPWE